MSDRKPMWLSIILLWIAVITILGVNFIQGKRIDTLEDQVANLEAAQLEMLDLIDRMVDVDQNLAEASIANSNSVSNNSKSIGVLLQMVNDHEAFNRATIAEIYQGHIIPLRALHMESGD